MRALLRGVARASIWAPGVIPESERKYAEPLKRFFFPGFDVLMIVAAIRALNVGVPSVDDLFPQAVAVLVYGAWVLFATVCLVGASFPRLWPWEIGGKVALFITLAIYFIALRVAATTDDGARDVVSVFVATSMCIPLLRLWILGIEERDRKAG